MNLEEKKDFVSGMFQGANLEHAQVNVFVERGAKAVYKEVTVSADKPKKALTREDLVKAIKAVQQYMWGASAYAVLFCECRDHRDYPNVYSQFEEVADEIAQENGLSWRCKPGTLSDAFSDNDYLKLNVDKWKDAGAKKRSLLLLEKFQNELP